MQYTKPPQFQTTPALKDSDKNMAVSMKAKEALIQRSALPKPPINLIEPLVTPFGSAHSKITKEVVALALIAQSTTKVSGLDKINFQILQMIWGWNKAQITSMIYHTIRLHYHPRK